MLAAARVKERNRAGIVSMRIAIEKTEVIGHRMIATFNFSF
jgi:hypothetical protein